MTTATAQPTPPSDWVLSAQTLQQIGWTGTGLSTGDALEAERTAWTFTDREMSLDYRNAGTQAQHSGTFTAAVFLLTPNARARFFQNDVRVINNVLFDRVEQQHLIQQVVNAQPRLVQFQFQGQQEFAWVEVPFQLWQSQLNPQTGQRVEGLELDPATHGPVRPPHDRPAAARDTWHAGSQRPYGRHGLAGQHLCAGSSGRELTNCHSTGLTFHNRLLWSKLPCWILLTVKAREVFATKRFEP
jgi:hypothetical protein